jgi:hypothetical protein
MSAMTTARTTTRSPDAEKQARARQGVKSRLDQIEQHVAELPGIRQQPELQLGHQEWKSYLAAIFGSSLQRHNDFAKKPGV